MSCKVSAACVICIFINVPAVMPIVSSQAVEVVHLNK